MAVPPGECLDRRGECRRVFVATAGLCGGSLPVKIRKIAATTGFHIRSPLLLPPRLFACTAHKRGECIAAENCFFFGKWDCHRWPVAHRIPAAGRGCPLFFPPAISGNRCAAATLYYNLSGV